jgi:regulator of protease activity HflC (stomatin/prohibitin superfamily)
VLIREIHPSADLLKSIEAKLVNAQQAQSMEFTIQKERLEADRKKIEAEGIRQFQEIVTRGITPSLLEWKGIEATNALAHSTNAKIVVIGRAKDGLPVIFDGK